MKSGNKPKYPCILCGRLISACADGTPWRHFGIGEFEHDYCRGTFSDFDTDYARRYFEQMKRAMPTDGPCIDCGREDVTFQVLPDLWSKVTLLPANGGVLCPRCFELRAIRQGIKLGNWHVEQL